MKRCPECRRDYYDDSLLYCLDDGSALVDGPASVGEPATAILRHQTDHSSESPTKAQVHLTGESVTYPPPAGVPQTKTMRPAVKILLLCVLLAAVAAAAGVVTYRSFQPAASLTTIHSIAVMPFENRSGSSDTDYLSDGLTDSLIFRFSQLPDLKVSPTSSVMRYKGTSEDVADIAKELEVDGVLSGRLMQVGDNLSISVQLIDVRTKKLVWAEQYDRKMADLLATQREIAATITQKLELKLSGEASKGVTKKYTDSNEAYQLYLKGRYYWSKRDEQSLRKAIEQFKAAVDQDPGFALAFVGLADCYAVLPFYSASPPSEVIPQAKAYAERALQIDTSLGEEHSSLGYADLYSWNWSEAEKKLKRGIELNPNYATAHKFYANYLGNIGRWDEALVALKRAQELEPLNLIVMANLADAYLAKGDMQSAAEQCQRGLDLDPNWFIGLRELSYIYLKQGRPADAVAAAEKSVEVSKRATVSLAFLGHIYAQAGRQNDAIAILKELKEKYDHQQSNGYDIARVYIGLGEKDQAFAWLEKDVESRNAVVATWLHTPPFSELRDDPRFKALTQKIGMPQ